MRRFVWLPIRAEAAEEVWALTARAHVGAG